MCDAAVSRGQARRCRSKVERWKSIFYALECVRKSSHRHKNLPYFNKDKIRTVLRIVELYAVCTLSLQ